MNGEFVYVGRCAEEGSVMQTHNRNVNRSLDPYCDSDFNSKSSNNAKPSPIRSHHSRDQYHLRNHTNSINTITTTSTNTVTRTSSNTDPSNICWDQFERRNQKQVQRDNANQNENQCQT
jgi:hypothetical protein